MTEEQELICGIAKQMHKNGCKCKECDFNPNLESYQEWQNPNNAENFKYLEYAKRVLSMLWENDISYSKFISAYSKFKRGRYVRKKMKDLMYRYEIL